MVPAVVAGDGGADILLPLLRESASVPVVGDEGRPCRVLGGAILGCGAEVHLGCGQVVLLQECVQVGREGLVVVGQSVSVGVVSEECEIWSS